MMKKMMMMAIVMLCLILELSSKQKLSKFCILQSSLPAAFIFMNGMIVVQPAQHYHYYTRWFFFSHLYPPKELEYGKPGLCESTLT